MAEERIEPSLSELTPEIRKTLAKTRSTPTKEIIYNGDLVPVLAVDFHAEKSEDQQSVTYTWEFITPERTIVAMMDYGFEECSDRVLKHLRPARVFDASYPDCGGRPLLVFRPVGKCGLDIFQEYAEHVVARPHESDEARLVATHAEAKRRPSEGKTAVAVEKLRQDFACIQAEHEARYRAAKGQGTKPEAFLEAIATAKARDPGFELNTWFESEARAELRRCVETHYRVGESPKWIRKHEASAYSTKYRDADPKNFHPDKPDVASVKESLRKRYAYAHKKRDEMRKSAKRKK